MEPSDLSHLEPSGSPLLNVIRLIGAFALTLIAIVGVLVVLELLPRSVLSAFALKAGLVATIVCAAIALVTLLVPSRRA